MTGSMLIGAAAAFAAAAVNAIAGGGTFIAFPTLTGALGLSEKLANATCTVGLWPGYGAGIVAGRSELASTPRGALKPLTWMSLAGGAAGGGLLLLTPAGAFRAAVPILLAIGTTLFAAGPIVNRQSAREESRATPSAASLPILFAVAVYNGYFGAGGGVLVMAGLTACGLSDPRRANIFKMMVQMTSNAAAVAVLVWSGIAWQVALGMIPGALAGGFAGMRLANLMPRHMLRAIIIAAGAILTIVYGAKIYL